MLCIIPFRTHVPSSVCVRDALDLSFSLLSQAVSADLFSLAVAWIWRVLEPHKQIISRIPKQRFEVFTCTHMNMSIGAKKEPLTNSEGYTNGSGMELFSRVHQGRFTLRDRAKKKPFTNSVGHTNGSGTELFSKVNQGLFTLRNMYMNTWTIA